MTTRRRPVAHKLGQASRSSPDSVIVVGTTGRRAGSNGSEFSPPLRPAPGKPAGGGRA